MSRSGTYECPACGKVNENADAGTLWMNTPLGITTIRCCPTQACGKAALASAPEGWKMREGNRPPEAKNKIREVR